MNRAKIKLDYFIEGVHDVVHSLPEMKVLCHHCNAKRFKNEPAGFCCSKGKIQIALPPALPNQLQHLLQQQEFKNKVRKYNQAFAFTSLGATKVDRRLANNRQGIYTFRVNGQFHHQIGTVLAPQNGQDPKYF